MKFAKIAAVIVVISFIAIPAAVLFIRHKKFTNHDDVRHANLSSQANELGGAELQFPGMLVGERTQMIWDVGYFEDKSQLPNAQARLNQLDRQGKAVILKQSAVSLQNGSERLILNIEGADRIRSLHVNPSGTLFSVVAEFEDLDRILVFKAEGGEKLAEFPHADFVDVFRRDYLSCFWLDDHHIGKVSRVPRSEFFGIKDRYDFQMSAPIPGANESSAEDFLTFGITNIGTLGNSFVAVPLPRDRVIQFNHEMQESGWISLSERIGNNIKDFWLEVSPRH